jgi:hypothetical protein
MSLKITQYDLSGLREAVLATQRIFNERGLTKEAYAARDERIPRIEKAKDPMLRYRWDLLNASGFNVCGLYDYLNDTHIDSALRTIV